jgi:hypothetical protein
MSQHIDQLKTGLIQVLTAQFGELGEQFAALSQFVERRDHQEASRAHAAAERLSLAAVRSVEGAQKKRVVWFELLTMTKLIVTSVYTINNCMSMGSKTPITEGALKSNLLVDHVLKLLGQVRSALAKPIRPYERCRLPRLRDEDGPEPEPEEVCGRLILSCLKNLTRAHMDALPRLLDTLAKELVPGNQETACQAYNNASGRAINVIRALKGVHQANKIHWNLLVTAESVRDSLFVIRDSMSGGGDEPISAAALNNAAMVAGAITAVRALRQDAADALARVSFEPTPFA